jgi:hypothetical protein
MARAKKAEAPAKLPLGMLTDSLWKKIESDMERITSELIERLEAEGLDSAKGKLASITVTPSTQPNIEDWDVFCAWVKRTGNWQLIRRQINAEPWRSLMETKPVPGTSAFIKKTLNVRTIS